MLRVSRGLTHISMETRDQMFMTILSETIPSTEASITSLEVPAIRLWKSALIPATVLDLDLLDLNSAASVVRV